MRAFSHNVARRLHSYSPTDLAVIAWSMSYLSYLPPQDWLQQYFARSLLAARSYRPADIASTLMALVRWDMVPERQYTRALLAQAKVRFGSCSAQCHTTLLWALTRLQAAVDPNWLALQLRYLRPHLRQMDAEMVGIVLYSNAMLAPKDAAKRQVFVSQNKSALWKVVQRSHEVVYEASAQDLYAGLVALARLQINPGRKYLKAHINAAQAHGTGYTEQQVAAMRAAYKWVRQQPLMRPSVERMR
jgi:hypothetical protein